MDNLNHNSLNNLVLNNLLRTDKKNFLVAISGGVDSMLLLNIVDQIRKNNNFNVRAIHINHNISDNSNKMQDRCIESCIKYNIDLVVKDIKDTTTKNIEEDLRKKRYKIIFDTMSDNEVVLLGHHNNDQIETFLYRLFRGSSPKGLSCMKNISYRNNKVICRPLLNISKNEIISLAEEKKIEYTEDETNKDLSLDRNYIRQSIIPVITKRWTSLNQSMKHNIELQDTYTKIALDYCDIVYDHIVRDDTLDIKTLKQYPNYFYSVFLKHWISKSINYNLSKNELNQIDSIIINGNNDYPKYKLRNEMTLTRYNDLLYIIKPSPILPYEKKIWDLKHDINFRFSRIKIEDLKENGLYDRLSQRAPLTLRSIQGKEKIMLNKENYQDLKKIFQSNSIPIWEREKFVLFFSDNTLLLAYGEKHVFISSELI